MGRGWAARWQHGSRHLLPAIAFYFAVNLANAAAAQAGATRRDTPGPACSPTAGLQFVCGAEHPEDLAHIPGTQWLIASGFSDGAGLKLIDTRTDTLTRWYTASRQQMQRDPA